MKVLESDVRSNVLVMPEQGDVASAMPNIKMGGAAAQWAGYATQWAGAVAQCDSFLFHCVFFRRICLVVSQKISNFGVI